ncbi:MAG: VWA domain-containing protein [Candidatus Berkelbacteria bacterium]|nr:VWA domain-containing protein [Candidatus Berkelbacteria bacterium]
MKRKKGFIGEPSERSGNYFSLSSERADKSLKNFARSWLFIGLIILVVLSLSGVGLVLAYKNGKFAQAQNPNSNPNATVNLASSQINITKTVTSSSNNNRYLNPGETFNTEIFFNGLKDEAPGGGPVDVMLVIDMSQSMDHGVGYNCKIYKNDDSSDPRNEITYDTNKRICFAKRAAVNFIKQAATKSIPIRVGYQMFSNYDETHKNTYFRGLKNIRDDAEKKQLISDLIGENGECHQLGCPSGTAMGLGLEKAAREIINHGTPNANRFVVILSDGKEVSYPSVAGCWNGCCGRWPDGYPASNNNDICGILIIPDRSDIFRRLDYVNNPSTKNAFVITPNMIATVNLETQLQDFCNKQSPRRVPCQTTYGEIVTRMNDYRDPDLWLFVRLYNAVYKGYYQGSAAEQCQTNNIKVLTLGYYRGSDEKYPEYLQAITANLYLPAEPGDLPPGYFPDDYTVDLEPLFNEILNIITGQTNGAPMDIQETLPPGADVTRPNVTFWRGTTQLTNVIFSLDRDGQGRRTIIAHFPKEVYLPNGVPENQNFSVKIHNITYSGSGCFDADQNYSAEGVALPDDQKPSKITWNFPASGGNPIIGYMPWHRMCASVQYSGDIYGNSIGTYAFPGIDVSVAKGDNSSTRAVWSLDHYNFSSSSYLNYNDFQTHFDKVIKDLENRAVTLPNSDTIFNNTNPHPDLNPGGAVWHAKDNLANLTISGPGQKTIGGSNNQRATVIVDGNLVFNNQADITKRLHSNNNLLFIVKGNVTIDASTVGIENVAIIAPYTAPYGNINAGNSAMSIKGLLAARNVVLEGEVASGRQRINYDPSLTLYSPPGLSSLDLPIFKEVKP